MAEKVLDPPPPYPGLPPGFEQNATMPDTAVAHTNVGFTAPQYPAYMPPQHHFVSQQQTNVVIAQVGRGGNVYVDAPVPVDYTTQAWIACLCCFWPIGLLAIVKANESRDALARGDLAAAHVAAESARHMVRLSVAIGFVTIMVLIIFIIFISTA